MIQECWYIFLCCCKGCYAFGIRPHRFDSLVLWILAHTRTGSHCIKIYIFRFVHRDGQHSSRVPCRAHLEIRILKFFIQVHLLFDTKHEKSNHFSKPTLNPFILQNWLLFHSITHSSLEDMKVKWTFCKLGCIIKRKLL